MFYEHVALGVFPIFRLKTKASKTVDEFVLTKRTDLIIEMSATKSVKLAILEKHPEGERKQIHLRVVKYSFSGTASILGTTLLDAKRYPITDLSDRYHSRLESKSFTKYPKL
jgi:hypothetical protein